MMTKPQDRAEDITAFLNEMPTLHPTSPPVDSVVARFWDAGPELESVVVRIDPPARPLALLEQLGPSPFQRGGFPVIGFLATTYDKVSRYARERGNWQTSNSELGSRQVQG